MFFHHFQRNSTLESFKSFQLTKQALKFKLNEGGELKWSFLTIRNVASTFLPEVV